MSAWQTVLGSVSVVGILMAGWIWQQTRKDWQTTNERMRRALGREYVEARVNAWLYEEPPAVELEPPACPECGGRQMHFKTCEYLRDLYGESDMERDRR